MTSPNRSANATCWSGVRCWSGKNSTRCSSHAARIAAMVSSGSVCEQSTPNTSAPIVGRHPPDVERGRDGHFGSSDPAAQAKDTVETLTRSRVAAGTGTPRRGRCARATGSAGARTASARRPGGSSSWYTPNAFVQWPVRALLAQLARERARAPSPVVVAGRPGASRATLRITSSKNSKRSIAPAMKSPTCRRRRRARSARS